MFKELQIPFLYDVDKTCSYTKRAYSPIKIPFEISELGLICTDQRFHIEIYKSNFYLRSKDKSIFCEKLVPEKFYIKNKNEHATKSEIEIITYTHRKIIFGVHYWLKTALFIDAFEIKEPTIELPDILKLLYAKSGWQAMSEQSEIYYYQWIKSSAQSKGEFIFDAEIHEKLINYDKKNKPSHIFQNTINPEFSEFFEENPSLMSDSEFEGINGFKR